jgi:hypothetical protein
MSALSKGIALPSHDRGGSQSSVRVPRGAARSLEWRQPCRRRALFLVHPSHHDFRGWERPCCFGANSSHVFRQLAKSGLRAIQSYGKIGNRPHTAITRPTTCRLRYLRNQEGSVLKKSPSPRWQWEWLRDLRRSVTQSRPAPPALGEVTAEMFSKRDKDDQMKATVTLLQVRRRDPPNPLRSRPVPDQAQLTPQRFKKKYNDVRVRPRADASIDPPSTPPPNRTSSGRRLRR